jgi:hypothetical protein
MLDIAMQLVWCAVAMLDCNQELEWQRAAQLFMVCLENVCGKHCLPALVGAPTQALTVPAQPTAAALRLREPAARSGMARVPRRPGMPAMPATRCMVAASLFIVFLSTWFKKFGR